MTTKTRLTILAACAALLPATAFTFVLLSPPRHWAATPVQICVKGPGHVSVADADRGVTATIQAINDTSSLLAGMGWNLTSSGQVTNAYACSSPWVLGDGNPTIAFNEMIGGTCGGSCLAATFTGYYNCSTLDFDGHCVITDSDIETRRNKADRYGGPYYSLNEACTAGREWNLEAIMVHEVGHQIGLGHTSVTGATMYPSVTSCNNGGATIAADDAAGMQALYPPPPPPEPLP